MLAFRAVISATNSENNVGRDYEAVPDKPTAVKDVYIQHPQLHVIALMITNKPKEKVKPLES